MGKVMFMRKGEVHTEPQSISLLFLEDFDEETQSNTDEEKS